MILVANKKKIFQRKYYLHVTTNLRASKGHNRQFKRDWVLNH